MLLNKKADINTIKGLIIGLIVIVVLWFVFIYLGDFLYGAGSKTACQIWVDKNSVTSLKEVFGNGEGSSPCVTTKEIIKSVDDRNELYEKIARNMYDCWDQYRRGEADFYSDFDWGSSDTHCRICSEIKFEQEVRNEIKEIDVDNFEIYLSQHNPPNSKLTYAEIFTKEENAKLDFGTDKIELEDQSIDSIFVVNKKNPGFFESLKSGLVTTVSGVIGIELTTGIPGKIIKGKGLGGKVTVPRAPSGGITIDGKFYKGGQFLPKGVASKGGIYTAVGILILGTAAYVASDGSELYPSLFLISSGSKDDISNVCDYVYYNPEQKPLQFINKQS